jgi:hypothetical protein
MLRIKRPFISKLFPTFLMVFSFAPVAVAGSPHPAATDGHQLPVAVATITIWCIVLIILGVSPKWVAAASFPFPLHCLPMMRFHQQKRIPS